MSAFICDKHTFSTIYSGMDVYGNSNMLDYSPIRYVVQKLVSQYGTIETVIAQFYALNVRAVNQRYREQTDERMPSDMVDTEWRVTPSLFQFLKTLECLQYQMSEGDVPEQELFTSLRELAGAVALSIAHLDRRYDEAQWG